MLNLKLKIWEVLIFSWHENSTRIYMINYKSEKIYPWSIIRIWMSGTQGNVFSTWSQLQASSQFRGTTSRSYSISLHTWKINFSYSYSLKYFIYCKKNLIQYMHDPRLPHLDATFHCLRYLLNDPGLRLYTS